MHVSPRPEGIGIGADVSDGARGSATSSGAKSTDFGPRAIAFNVAFWTLFGALQASSGLLLPRGDVFPFPGRLIASSLVAAYIWALLTPAIFRLAARVAPDQGVPLRRVLWVVLVGLIVSTLVAAVASTVNFLLVPAPGPPISAVDAARQTRGDAAAVAVPEEPAARLLRGLRVTLDAPGDTRVAMLRPHVRGVVRRVRRWYFQEMVTFFGVFVAGLVSAMSRRARTREREAAQLHAQASQLQAERAELRARTAQLQAEGAELDAQLAEARLAMLRSRFNPHFLFNTLNAVSALVGKDPKGVRDMIALVSELLRHALAETKDQEIPLHEELRLLRLYLEILEIRYQGQLRTVVTVDHDVHEALVPNMILQPLVENAMKHGIDRAGGHGTIEVLAQRDGDDLVLTVRDTGPADGSAPPLDSAGTGIGLRLTRERLAELYGTAQRLDVTPAPAGGMTARVILPYHHSEDVRLAEEVAPT